MLEIDTITILMVDTISTLLSTLNADVFILILLF